MFVNKAANIGFDAIECGEVHAKLIVPVGGEEEAFVRFVMAYTNSETGVRYGKATVPLDVLSQETKDKFAEFAESAERDWGMIALAAGGIVKEGKKGSIGTDEGLRNLGRK